MTARELLEEVAGEGHALHTVVRVERADRVARFWCSCGAMCSVSASEENLLALRNVPAQLVRGYLWRDLVAEVGEMFAGLGGCADLSASSGPDALSTWSAEGRERWWRQVELEEDRALGSELLGRLRARRAEVSLARRREGAAMLTPAERVRATRARRAAEGKCVGCERLREPGHSRCRAHLLAQRELDEKYREKKRMKKTLDPSTGKQAPIARRPREDVHLDDGSGRARCGARCSKMFVTDYPARVSCQRPRCRP